MGGGGGGGGGERASSNWRPFTTTKRKTHIITFQQLWLHNGERL